MSFTGTGDRHHTSSSSPSLTTDVSESNEGWNTGSVAQFFPPCCGDGGYPALPVQTLGVRVAPCSRSPGGTGGTLGVGAAVVEDLSLFWRAHQ